MISYVLGQNGTSLYNQDGKATGAVVIVNHLREWHNIRGKCVRRYILFAQKIYYFKIIARQLNSPSHDLVILDFLFVMLNKHKR